MRDNTAVLPTSQVLRMVQYRDVTYKPENDSTDSEIATLDIPWHTNEDHTQ